MCINFSTSGAAFAWDPACWLRVHGADAASFLQGQFSNDLRLLERPGEPAVYGLWLSTKGKVLADSFVVRGSGTDEYWVGSYFSRAEVVRSRLESFIVADEVVVEDETSGWTAVTVWGPGVGQGENLARGGEAYLFPGRRGGGPSLECVFRRGSGVAAMAASLAGRRLAAEEVARARIGERIPAVPQEIGPGDLPAEGGLDADAVSFTKGCYLGQEVMARLRSMGQVRRRLVRVKGAGDVPAGLPAPLFLAGRQVGDLRSAVAGNAGGWVGLAMVSRLAVAAATDLSLAAEGPAGLTVEDAP
ncbi:MAG: folate-binding protein [Verrucomicrobia bacterium]|nr:folate-binding protein [Verrucomicrobiota bacterium]